MLIAHGGRRLTEDVSGVKRKDRIEYSPPNS